MVIRRGVAIVAFVGAFAAQRIVEAAGEALLPRRMPNKLLLTVCAASLAACHLPVPHTLPTMQQFPPAADAPELEAIEPAVARAFIDAYPGLEIVKLAPHNTQWDIGHNEVTGIVTHRGAAFHLEFRKDGECYYARPIFWEQHVGTSWEAPRFARFEPLYVADIGNVQRARVENIDAARMSCDDAPATTAQAAATPR